MQIENFFKWIMQCLLFFICFEFVILETNFLCKMHNDKQKTTRTIWWFLL